jgi:cobalt-zinc-cadmium efflux system outer membrane protein
MDRTFVAASSRLDEHRSEEALPDLEGHVERDTIVRLAVVRSPALAVMAHRARATIHSGRAAGSLPTPEIGLEAWNLPLARPYALGEANMYMVELRQRFPAAGSLDARARAPAAEAEAMLAELATQERLVAARAATAYAEYVHGLRDHELHHQHLDLLEQMRGAVVARLSTGGTALAEAARVDVEMARTRRAIARIDGEIARARSTINALLRRPMSAPLGPPADDEPQTVRATLDELVAQADAVRGSAVSSEARARGAAANREAAEAEARIPEFMVGVGYWQDPQMRPGFGANLSMTLPWLWGPARDRVSESRELELAAREGYDAAILDARVEIGQAHAVLRAAEQQLITVHQQGVPAAHRSIEGVQAGYATGRATLLEWIDASRSLLDLEMEEAELAAAMALAIAALEQAVGADLPRVNLVMEVAR